MIDLVSNRGAEARPAQHAEAGSGSSAHQETDEFFSITVRQGGAQGQAQPVLGCSCSADHTLLADGKT